MFINYNIIILDVKIIRFILLFINFDIYFNL